MMPPAAAAAMPAAAAVDQPSTASAAYSTHTRAFAPYRRRQLVAGVASNGNANAAAARSSDGDVDMERKYDEGTAAAAATARLSIDETLDDGEDADHLLTDDHVAFLFEHQIRSRKWQTQCKRAGNARSTQASTLCLLIYALAISLSLSLQPTMFSAAPPLAGLWLVVFHVLCSFSCNRASALVSLLHRSPHYLYLVDSD